MKGIAKAFINRLGWSTPRKIVVIESDDWGSTRIPNKEIRDLFISKGIRLDKNIFTKYDCLESSLDVERLCCTLNESPKDIHGMHPKITLLSLTHNPDFESMNSLGGDSLEYQYESVLKTYERYGYNTFRTLRYGFTQNLLTTELHGREHLNVCLWLNALRSKKYPTTNLAFKNGFYGIHPEIANEKRQDFQAAFDLNSEEDYQFQKSILEEAVLSFEYMYGRRPNYFVPPNGPYNDALDQVLVEGGVRSILHAKNRKMPTFSNRSKRKFHYLGQRKKSGLTVITRNVTFEPSRGSENEISKALCKIKEAFLINKPAIISTHRVNYVGGVEEANRSDGNLALANLLSQISKTWPQVEYLSSVELTKLIAEE